jgi:hypothetical protein
MSDDQRMLVGGARVASESSATLGAVSPPTTTIAVHLG